jgi:hypothetical protein
MAKEKVSCTLCEGVGNFGGGMYCGRCNGKGFLYKITCGGRLVPHTVQGYSEEEGYHDMTDYKKCTKCGEVYGSLYEGTTCNQVTYEAP